MATFTNTSSKKQALSVNSIVSAKSNKTIAWINFTDSYAQQVLDCKNAQDIDAETAIEALEELIVLLREGKALPHTVDTTEAPITISPEEF